MNVGGGGFTWLNRSDSVMQKLNIYGEPYILGKAMAPNFDMYPLPSPYCLYICVVIGKEYLVILFLDQL